MTKFLRYALQSTTCLTLLMAGCCLIPSVSQPPNSKDIEPNDDVSRAVEVVLDPDGTANLGGAVTSDSDIDVFDLGPVSRGDSISLEVRATGLSSLDTLAALFDEDIELVNYNDDEDYGNQKLDSVIEHIVRHDSDHYYLAITGSQLASGWDRIGAYDVQISIERGGTVPDTVGQTVLLDFDGASVDIPGARIYNIGPFDAGEVDVRLDGKDHEVKQNIKSTLEAIYAPYDVEFVTTDDPLPPEGTYARIVFGGQSSSLFGLAQWADHYNARQDDEAIIFTEDWTDVFSVTPTVDAIYTSIGNVAAHELGHLLGLEHTADITGLMDASGAANTVLVPQEFSLSPLHDDAFPFGWQNAPELLLDTLGPATMP